MRAIGRLVMMSLVVIGLMPFNARAQAARSADAAAILAKLLDAQHLDAVAAPDPDEPRRFIAALSFADTQLLVITAEYPVPIPLEQRLERGEFRQIYVDLQLATPPVSRFFVHDMNADGLRPTAGPDTVFEGVVNETTFDGDWVRQGLSQAEYQGRFAAADERYARMLAALVEALRSRT